MHRIEQGMYKWYLNYLYYGVAGSSVLGISRAYKLLKGQFANRSEGLISLLYTRTHLFFLYTTCMSMYGHTYRSIKQYLIDMFN